MQSLSNLNESLNILPSSSFSLVISELSLTKYKFFPVSLNLNQLYIGPKLALLNTSQLVQTISDPL
jgi:hypothetical protein